MALITCKKGAFESSLANARMRVTMITDGNRLVISRNPPLNSDDMDCGSTLLGADQPGPKKSPSPSAKEIR